jgi:hypothetical protein
LPHGGKTSLRIEIGISIIGEGESEFLGASHVKALDFKAPTIVYTGCCKGANSFMLDEGLEIDDFVTSAFIHAGCVAYIATPEIQSTCFWEKAPYGVSTQQTIYTWEKLLSSNMPLGKALLDAKWDAREWAMDEWPEENDLNGTFEIDCIIYNLFGDPALEPYKPDIPFDTKKELDVHINYGEVKAGESLSVDVDLTVLDSGEAITSATITIIFNGVTKTGNNVTFDVPKDGGEYEIKVTVGKEGYHDTTAKYSVNVGSEEDEGDGEGDDNTLIYIGILIIIIVIALFLSIRTRKKA